VGINDALRDGQDRRAWKAFDRRSWQRHPVLAGLRAAGALGVAIVGLISAFGYDHHRPSWLTSLFFLCLIGSFVCWVLLVRRDED
jgi:hypothetical protein